jgi:glycopeptide antibiotics resistance protein
VRGARASHRQVWEENLFWEDIFNVFMLLPVGALLPIISGGNGRKSGEKSSIENRTKTRPGRIILIGFLISLTIEILQLVTKRGLFEFDDIFHNTLGVAVGELAYWIWQKVKLG